MTVGWDFTFDDGIRDRNTGIWRPVNIYKTGPVALRDPFVKSRLSHPDYDRATESVSVMVHNPASGYSAPVQCVIKGDIVEADIHFERTLTLLRGESPTIVFDSLTIDNPRLWWPKNKGPQSLYTLKLRALVQGSVSDSAEIRFGIREIQTSTDTPDHSKIFIVNGRRIFVRGSNWIPEAMLRSSDDRMRTEMAYTDQSGINLLRLWGGGIAESDLFYELCDQYGILVWQEFWMTGDTRHPSDRELYFRNVESTVRRIRNHPSVAFYVSSNESTEVSGIRELLDRLDGTRPYQMQSECDGVHDGSPYKQVNPMQHYTNTASDRGSRIDGFNPEYGAPTLPVAESLREMMPESALWPIDRGTWDYLDGNGFHLMTGLYRDMIGAYGLPTSIEDYAAKGQLVGAVNSKSIWEVWNRNRLDSGDRFCSGLLFWYHNCPNVQVCARMWDWFLEPTASLYHTMHALEKVHVQFDYLKNTVSVVNDAPEPLSNLRLEARLFDLGSHVVKSWKTDLDIAADAATCDALVLDFPESVSKVHFISLRLEDSSGRVLSENFYWRSKAVFEGPGTVTGPCTSGFESLGDMPRAKVSLSRRTLPDGRIEVTVRNRSSRIAFFNRMQLRDGAGLSVRGTVYSDNFFTLLPHESKTVLLTPGHKSDSFKVYFEGWNSPSCEI